MYTGRKRRRMKSVLRSCFEPLPRFLSTKCLVSLVALVLVGTGISVHEYLESTSVPARAVNSGSRTYLDSSRERRPAPDAGAPRRPPAAPSWAHYGAADGETSRNPAPAAASATPPSACDPIDTSAGS